MDRLGHPIKRDVIEQFILGEAAFHVAVAVGPVTKFLDDPRSQRRRRIVQTVGRGLRRVALQVSVGPKVNVPAIRGFEERCSTSSSCGPDPNAAGRIRECS